MVTAVDVLWCSKTCLLITTDVYNNNIQHCQAVCTVTIKYHNLYNKYFIFSVYPQFTDVIPQKIFVISK